MNIDKTTGLLVIGGQSGNSGGGGGGDTPPPAAGGTEFYKCAAVYGPRKVTRIKVENAGTAAVNGEYELTTLKTSSGGEVWKHTEADYYYYSESDYNWGIDADYNMPVYRALYYHDMAEPTSSNSYWNTGYDYDNDKATGIDPAPTVSEIQITVDADAPKTWDGYKAVLTDGIYDFETELTTGLTYGTSYVPVVGGIYSADALVQVTGLFDNIVNRFPGSASLFAIDANIGINDLVTGTAPTLIGSGEVLQNGEFCFDNTRAFDYVIGESMSDLKEFTIEMDYTITSNTTGYCGFFGNKRSWSTMCCQFQWGRSGYRPTMFWNDYFDTRTGGAEHPEWVNDGVYHHVAMVKKGEVVTLYSEGKAITTYEGATKSLNLAVENLLAVGTQHVENQIFPGRMKHFRVIGSAIYDGDFEIPEWVGKGSDSDNGDSGDSGSGDSGDSGSGDSGDSGGGDNGGSDDDKTYTLTISGFPAEYADANGDYWDTGETSAGQPIHYNGKKYLLKGDIVGVGNDDFWGFSPDNTLRSVECFSSGADVTLITVWYKEGGAVEITGVTVKQYYPGGVPLASAYRVQGAGIVDFNGVYYDTGDVDPVSERPIFQYEYGFRLRYSETDYRWELMDPNGNVVYYCETIGTPIEAEWKALFDYDGPAPIVTRYYE